MICAAIHVQAALTAPVAIITLAWLGWYWRRLGNPDVPRSRRRIRRVSLATIALCIPLLMAALSLLDPQMHARLYVAVWSSVLGLAVLAMCVAGLDAMNNVRLLQEQRQDALHETAAALARDIRERRLREASAASNGERVSSRGQSPMGPSSPGAVPT